MIGRNMLVTKIQYKYLHKIQVLLLAFNIFYAPNLCTEYGIYHFLTYNI
jgi:hypothetical protein